MSDRRRDDEANIDILQEIRAWVDQYVLEVNVDPLVATFDRKIEASAKKCFKE